MLRQDQLAGIQVFGEVLFLIVGLGAVLGRRGLAQVNRRFWEAIFPAGGGTVERVAVVLWATWGVVAVLATTMALIVRVVEAVGG